MIKIKNLNKYYNKGKDNEIHVIHDVTLELPDTGLISFLGASGSGKTTLLNVIGGLDRAKGSISYDSMTMENYKMGQIDKFRSKEIGYVFQNYNLLLEETVYSNLEIALEMIGIFDKEEQEKRIEYTLKAVGMFKYRKKRAYALSGGQQQRVSIARALVKQAKIIIADEPTGNLDSENTIEVMNILKKISKTSLVLVVTHNDEVANFYSDEVIKIKDGAIISTAKNDGGQALNTEQANTIYLKDLNLLEDQTENLSIKYYSTKEPKSLELRIIEKNGTYYISASEKLKLLEDTNIKLVDSHYKALKQEALEQFDYDTSWFSRENGRENIFKRMLKGLVTSFNKLRFSKRRTKFLYASFFIIGVLLAICVFGFSNYYIIDESNLYIDKKYDVIKTDEWYTSNSANYIDATYSIMPYIKNINSISYKNAKFSEKINYKETFEYDFYFSIISYKGNENLKLLAGSAPEKGELLISKKIADDFIKEAKEFYRSYEEMIGIKIDSYRVSGIAEQSYALAYLNDETYMSRYDYYSNYLEVREYSIEKKYNTYDIIEGRDLTEEDLDQKNILIPSDYHLYQSQGSEILNQEINFGKDIYKIVGVFKLKKYFNPSIYDFIIHQSNFATQQIYNQSGSYDYKDYEIVEGKSPEKFDECIASVYSGYHVGDELQDKSGSSQTFKVVGLYISNNEEMGKCVLFSREVVILSNNYNAWLLMSDSNEADTILREQKFYSINIYDYYYRDLAQTQKENLLVFGIMSLVLIIAISVFIYFMMRSRMIADIYPIGVYRSIGASRVRILLRFVSDIFVTITFTALIGYLLTTFIFDTVSANVNNALSMNALKSSYLFSFLGALILYVLNFFFGLLPITMLMRKTPAEIIAKYDI